MDPQPFSLEPLVSQVGAFSEIPHVLDLVDEKADILKQPTERFDFDNPPCDPIVLYRNLGETMLHHNGLGLAAPQCGLNYRAFVLRTHPEVLGVFNPILVDKSEEEITLEEGCLSAELLFIKVKRPKRIRVRFTTPDGQTNTHVFDGMTARCFLHELDHLDGITMWKRANKLHVEAGRKKRKKIRDGKLVLKDA